MIKICFRVMLFFLSFMLYLVSGIVLLFDNRFGNLIFLRLIKCSIKGLMKSLDITVIPPVLEKEKASDYTLYIANHDSIMDGLFLMAYLDLRMIIEVGIKNFIPFTGCYMRRLDQVLVQEGNSRSETNALFEGLDRLKRYHRFAIFPSAGIRSLNEYFASGVYFLAKKTNANIVPLFFSYEPTDAFLTIPLQTALQFFWRCIVYGKRTLICRAGANIPIGQLGDEEAFICYVKSLYQKNVYALNTSPEADIEGKDGYAQP